MLALFFKVNVDFLKCIIFHSEAAELASPEDILFSYHIISYPYLIFSVIKHAVFEKLKF